MPEEIYDIQDARILIENEAILAMMSKRRISKEGVKLAIREAEFKYSNRLGEIVCLGYNGIEVIYEVSDLDFIVTHVRKRMFSDDS